MKKTLYELFDEATPTELDAFSKELEAPKLRQEVLSSVKNKVYAKTKLAQSEKERIITMKKEKIFKRFYGGILASAACVAMLLGCFVGYSAFFNDPSTDPAITHVISTTKTPLVATTITLDVNPSIEISADEEEKVIEVVALNKDAEVIMGGVNFEGNSLETTVNTLIDSMIEKGYINEKTNSVLLSVENKDENAGNTIKDKLSAEISDLISTESIGGSVISQTVSSDDKELSDLASQYGITLGKAKLIRTIMKINDEKDFSEYAKMNITELNKAMNDNADKPKDEKTYIGEEKAIEMALKEANLTLNDLSAEPSIELVTSRGEICYLVRLTVEKETEDGHSSRTYGIYVNAFTGGGHGENVNDPNFTIEEAWGFVCDEMGVDTQNANLLDQRFNGMTTALPMTYSFYFEIASNEYYALVDAMNGVVIRIVEK